MGVDLGSAHGRIVLDAAGAVDGVRNAQTALDKFGSSCGKLGKKMSLEVTAPLVLMGIKAVDAASDLNESMNKVAVVFDESGEAVTKWSENSARAFGLSQQKALEAVGTFGNLFDSLGLAESASSKMSRGMVELAADLASFNNINPTLALEKLRAGLVGEAEPLRTLGVNLSEAAVQVKALEMGLADTAAELDAADKVQARYALILEQTANAQGDFARTSDGLANSTRIAKAEMEDAAAKIGASLMPMAQNLAVAVAGLAERFAGLPGPVQNSVLAVAGLAAAAGPTMTAVSGLTKAIGFLASPVGLAVVGVGALVGGLVYLNTRAREVERQTTATAAGILDTATSYTDYVAECRDAGVVSKVLSEKLYQVYQASKQAQSGIDALKYQEAADAARKMALGLTEDWQAFAQGAEQGARVTEGLMYTIRGNLGTLSNLEVSLLLDRDALVEWVRVARLGGEGAQEFARVISEAARAELDNRTELQLIDARMAAWGSTLSRTTETQIKATAAVVAATASNQEMKDGLAALAEAADTVKAAFEGTYGALAEGIVGLRDLDGQAQESAANYQEALRNLEMQAAQSYGSIRKKYQESLPDATSVQERAGMVADAWDEWALRMGALMDGVQGDTEAGWLAFLQATTAGTDLALKEGQEGLTEWMGRLREAFYGGELQGLINTGSAAWQAHAAEVAAAQAAETAGVRGEIANRRAALEEERAAEVAAQAAARERAVLELSLQVAEESGLLAAWSAQRLGAYAGVGDTAKEVLALLDSGMLTVDRTLAQIISNTAAGVSTALDTTGAQAEATKSQITGLLDAAAQVAVDRNKQVEDLNGELNEAKGALNEAIVNEEDTAAIRQRIKDIQLEIQNLTGQAGKTDDPFAPLLRSFTGVRDGIMTAAGTMQTSLETAFRAIQKTANDEVAANILDVWLGHSVIPDLMQSGVDLSLGWKLRTLEMTVAWKTMSDGVLLSIDDIIKALALIPRRIDVYVYTHYAEAEAEAEGESGGGNGGGYTGSAVPPGGGTGNNVSYRTVNQTVNVQAGATDPWAVAEMATQQLRNQARYGG